MNVSFRSTALAALCNSERRLAERWGEAGRAVGRRLLELAAIDAAHLADLPGVDVTSDGTGETTISFGSIVIKGEITPATSAVRAAGESDRIIITRVTVGRGEGR